jgi:transcriptional regulator with XRE-family HTH domain
MAKALLAQRHARGATQADVADAANKNTATVTYWESGTTEPGALALARACLFLGCTPNDVLLQGDVQGFGAELKPDQHVELMKHLKLVRGIMARDPQLLHKLNGLLSWLNEKATAGKTRAAVVVGPTEGAGA